MINLFKYIKESLFDDEEEQMDRLDGAVMLDHIKKADSKNGDETNLDSVINHYREKNKRLLYLMK